MKDRLTDEAVEVAANGHNNTWTLVEVVRSLGAEVRASRKLIADLRALVAGRPRNVPIADLPSAGDIDAAVLRLIEGAGL